MSDDRFILRGFFVLFAIILVSCLLTWLALAATGHGDRFPADLADIAKGFSFAILGALGLRGLTSGLGSGK